MSEYLIQSETLDDIADAINAKTGGSSAMTPVEMVTAISAIPSGGDGLPSGWNIIMDERITPTSSNMSLPFPRTITVPSKYVLIWYAPTLTAEVESETLASGYRLILLPVGAWGGSIAYKVGGGTISSGWTNLRDTSIYTDSAKIFGAGVEYRVILVEVTS